MPVSCQTFGVEINSELKRATSLGLPVENAKRFEGGRSARSEDEQAGKTERRRIGRHEFKVKTLVQLPINDLCQK